MTADTQTYAYRGASTLASGQLLLQTSGGHTEQGVVANPRFFTGFLTAGDRAAAGLMLLADVARTDFRRSVASWDAFRGGLRDPVVTAGGDRLRFESFSSCCGAYARLDVLEDGLDGEMHVHGTTNVDINRPLYTALSRVGRGEPLRLGVGPDEVAVTTMEGTVVEKKVPLPQRWLRSLAEVPAIAAGFDLRAELPAAQAMAFLSRLPNSGNTVRWLLSAGRTLRMTSGPVAGAICLAAPGRLVPLRSVLRHARTVRVYGPAVTTDSGPAASAWEVDLGGMRLTLMLSPDTFRGFSGEGALLTALTAEHGVDDADLVSPALGWDPVVDTGAIADLTGLAPDRVRQALAALATSGKVGYDCAEAAWFHRELPYDPARIAALNPRLASAQLLVEGGQVRSVDDHFEVRSGERTYLVHRVPGDRYGCTCAWWVDHRGGRGPCKHVLAVTLLGASTTTVGTRSEAGAR